MLSGVTPFYGTYSTSFNANVAYTLKQNFLSRMREILKKIFTNKIVLRTGNFSDHQLKFFWQKKKFIFPMKNNLSIVAKQNVASSAYVAEQMDFDREKQVSVTDGDKHCMKKLESTRKNNREVPPATVPTAETMDTESDIGAESEAAADGDSAGSRHREFSVKERRLAPNDELRCPSLSATSENENEGEFYRSASQPTSSDKSVSERRCRRRKSESPRTISRIDIESAAVCSTYDQPFAEDKTDGVESFQKNIFPASLESKKSKANSEKQKKAHSRSVRSAGNNRPLPTRMEEGDTDKVEPSVSSRSVSTNR